jgi:hypothetical protein
MPLTFGDASSGIASTIQEHALDEIDEHHEDGFPSSDDPVPWNDEESDTHVDKQVEPNKCVMKLYEEILELRSNPLGLDRFSYEKKVHIELLHLLKVLHAPLKAFTHILKWAAQANNSGHVFRVDCQPSRKNVVQKLYCRYKQHEGINTEGKASLSPLFSEDGVNDIFRGLTSLCLSPVVSSSESR